ncbi:hypothetical protein PIB30_014760 [Stylosanthes scabra]|uniref:Uncharacterized protein n=1 Tax=Stylosanthes scabra TaxID=79078 RepID=A0ABU6Y4W4_9FABA|nr:hypothetical protein [Stylosanthes scabra]
MHHRGAGISYRRFNGVPDLPIYASCTLFEGGASLKLKMVVELGIVHLVVTVTEEECRAVVAALVITGGRLLANTLDVIAVINLSSVLRNIAPIAPVPASQYTPSILH